jgi:hypothetical protein
MHNATHTLIVIQGLVPCASVVPERNRSILPVKPIGELGLLSMLIKVVEKRFAFFFGPTVETDRKARIDEKSLGLTTRPSHEACSKAARGLVRLGISHTAQHEAIRQDAVDGKMSTIEACSFTRAFILEISVPHGCRLSNYGRPQVH